MQAFNKIWLQKPIFYKSIKLPLQTQESKCLFLPCWTERMMENSSKWEPVAGFGVGQRVQQLQCAAAPLPHTSPFSCKLLLTIASMPEGSEQSTVAERECVETFRWRTGRQLLVNGQKGQELAPPGGASQKTAGWKVSKCFTAKSITWPFAGWM